MANPGTGGVYCKVQRKFDKKNRKVRKVRNPWSILKLTLRKKKGFLGPAKRDAEININ